MTTLSVTDNYDACRILWNAFIPEEVIFDLWEIRNCFHKAFGRQLCFVTAEKNGKTTGFLPLCIIPESSTLGYFPGESWHGKTWLEQNRAVADDRETLKAMIDFVCSRFGMGHHIRYLLSDFSLGVETEDETGYIFTPSKHGFSMDGYYSSFSGKNAKKMKRESSVYEKSVNVVYDRFEDFEILIQMNRDRFGNDSYFSDSRFAHGFRNLAEYLKKNGMLRITTVTVDGEYAAIDAGSIFNNTYTLFAGGTNPKFQGIAKFINTLHLKYSCEMKFDHTDFLCGDFGWKGMFHLEPRPLYKISDTEESVFEKFAEACHAR